MENLEEPKTPHLEWWVAQHALPGQTTSGDHHLVQEFPHGTLLAAVDGLGHGSEAAAAAEAAIQVLRGYSHDPVLALVNRCHEALRGTRGVVMSLAQYDAREATVTWTGVGNVEGMVLRPQAGNGAVPTRLLLRRGVVGARLPPLHVSTFPVQPRDLLILTTDGIAGDFDRGLDPDSPLQVLAEGILARHGRNNDDALILIARIVEACA